MDQSDWSGFPFPPARARRASRCCCAKYAFFGVLPLVIPSVLLTCRCPSNRSRASRAPTSNTSASWPTTSATSSTSIAGPVPGDEQGLLGSADQSRSGAAGAQRRHGRLHQRREPAFHLRPGEEQDSDGLHLQLRRPGSAFPFPFRRSRRSIRRWARFRRSPPICCRPI